MVDELGAVRQDAGLLRQPPAPPCLQPSHRHCHRDVSNFLTTLPSVLLEEKARTVRELETKPVPPASQLPIFLLRIKCILPTHTALTAIPR